MAGEEYAGLTVMNDGLSNISAAHDGQLYYFKTNGDFVFKGIGNEFAAVYSSQSRLVTILSGEGVCGGRHVTERKIGSSNSQITLPANSAGYLSIRIDTSHAGTEQDPDTFLRAGSTLTHGDLNNGDTVRDLPLYAYITNANSITSFVDIRPRTAGNGFILRIEGDGELYADYIKDGVKKHRKLITKDANFIDLEGRLLLACIEQLAFDDDQGQTYYDDVYNALNNIGE